MAFEPGKWADGPEGGTPITADELNRIEAAGAAKAATGPKGDKGDTGAAGPAGPKGAKGDPGFGTEAQYNDIISRIEALETPTEGA